MRCAQHGLAWLPEGAINGLVPPADEAILSSRSIEFADQYVSIGSYPAQSYRASCAFRASRKPLYHSLESPKDDESRRPKSRRESFQS